MVWDGSSLWYAGGTLIGRFDAASGQMSTYPLESKTADRIATDGLKNIWFGSQGGTELGVLQSDSGQISTRSMAAVVENLYWLAVGTDQVWMSDGDSQFIYAFSLTKSGGLSLSVPANLQAGQSFVSFSLASLPTLP
jgi:streptogramin lyase